MADRWLLNNRLEALYSIKAWISKIDRPKTYIPRPEGFLVAEPRPVYWSGEWTLYYIRKKEISTVRAGQLLAKSLGASKFDFYGLKDTNAVAYQHIALLKPRTKPKHIVVDDMLEAWFVADNVARPVRGLHGWNVFRIILAPYEPAECRSGYLFPNYYGPQRFGVCRPNTHIMGYYIARRERKKLREEMERHYPLDRYGGPKRLTKFIKQIALSALQSYIWNKSLSIAIEENALSKGSKWLVSPTCPRHSQPDRVPALPLPSPRRIGPEWWDEIVDRVLLVEGLRRSDLRWFAPKLRPALLRPCVSRCRRSGGVLVHLFVLPRGSYATVYLREGYLLDWVADCVGPARTLARRI